MQNELRAPRAGTVERVAVGEGETIDNGDLLVVAPMTRRPDAPSGDPRVERWRATTRATAARAAPERRERFATSSDIEIADLYTPADLDALGFDPDRDLGPARRAAVHPRRPGRRCTAAASGRCASTPASPRPRRRTSASATCSSRARPGCRSRSTCRPRWATTRMRPEAEGEVGRVGVPISSLADMEVLLDGLPLGEVSTSMTINATAADPAGAVRRRGREAGRRRGTGSRARPRTTSSRSTSPAARGSTRRRPRCAS